MTRGTVVVSGAGSGIGRAVACLQAEDGAHVTVVGRRRAPLVEVEERFGAERVDVVCADVSTTTGAAAVAERLRATDRPCAGLVAAAGGPHGGWVTGQVLSPNGGAVLGR